MKTGPCGQPVFCHPDELEKLIDLVERAQVAHGRPVRSAEVLSVARTDELPLLPQSSRGIARRLDVAAYRAGLFGRTIRRVRRAGHAEWAVWHQSDHLMWSSEQAIKAQIEALQAELARREAEARRTAALPNPFAAFACAASEKA